jgi:hypothetical protein
MGGISILGQDLGNWGVLAYNDIEQEYDTNYIY